VPSRTPAREDEFHPAAGNGFILETAVQAAHADGNTSTDLVYVSHETDAVDDNVTLTRVSSKDVFYPFFVTRSLRARRREDVIEQWAEIRHEEDGPVTPSPFASSSPSGMSRRRKAVALHKFGARPWRSPTLRLRSIQVAALTESPPQLIPPPASSFRRVCAPAVGRRACAAASRQATPMSVTRFGRFIVSQAILSVSGLGYYLLPVTLPTELKTSRRKNYS
jgi:hypothetical protein